MTTDPMTTEEEIADIRADLAEGKDEFWSHDIATLLAAYDAAVSRAAELERDLAREREWGQGEHFLYTKTLVVAEKLAAERDLARDQRDRLHDAATAALASLPATTRAADALHLVLLDIHEAAT